MYTKFGLFFFFFFFKFGLNSPIRSQDIEQEELSHDSVARLQMTIPDLGIRVDIMGRVLDPLLCVILADIQNVGIGACMHVCVWYTG